MQVGSFVAGQWQTSSVDGQALRDATTGEIVAQVSMRGVDSRAMLEHARGVGGPNLRRLTFHERAVLLKSVAKMLMEHKAELYALSYATGATKSDSWTDIEGGINTFFVYASKGTRELPNAHVYLDGPTETLSKSTMFVGQHICVPLEGAAVHINAFNFPIWGMLEKLAPTLLAGVPAIIKPATLTCYLAERAFRKIIESRILPDGAVQLICGSVGDLLSHLTGQDVVSFTGSASTAARLRQEQSIVRHSVRFTAETDSLNASILGPDAGSDTPEHDLYVREITHEMTAKAGQKCTAIRKALVPEAHVHTVLEALCASLGEVVVGDPRLEQVTMGPLASLSQRDEVTDRVSALRREAELVCGQPGALKLVGARTEGGAFFAPTLLHCPDASAADAVHTIEAFGPVCTVIPYRTVDEAISLARRGAGSLVSSVFSSDEALAARLVLGLAPFHGRILVVDRHCAKDSTGHGSPLPHLVHGGPGRAGGGEEMGGIRGVLHYMQRTAVQGTPDLITAVTSRFTRGAHELEPGIHPFRKPYGDLRIGDTFRSGAREVTVQDIESFARLSGDCFYAHMDEEAAKRNPLFGGRVAHGYFLVSAAAGLFVDPPYGPVLANYGLDGLRFLKPVKPGDRIKVRLTCKEKTLRPEKAYGEVRWDTEITNHLDETVATYDVLTLVSVHAVPDIAQNVLNDVASRPGDVEVRARVAG